LERKPHGLLGENLLALFCIEEDVPENYDVVMLWRFYEAFIESWNTKRKRKKTR